MIPLSDTVSLAQAFHRPATLSSGRRVNRTRRSKRNHEVEAHPSPDGRVRGQFDPAFDSKSLPRFVRFNPSKEQPSKPQRHPPEDHVVDNVFSRTPPDADRGERHQHQRGGEIAEAQLAEQAKGNLSFTALTTVKKTTVIAMNCMRSIFLATGRW